VRFERENLNFAFKIKDVDLFSGDKQGTRLNEVLNMPLLLIIKRSEFGERTYAGGRLWLS